MRGERPVLMTNLQSRKEKCQGEICEKATRESQKKYGVDP